MFVGSKLQHVRRPLRRFVRSKLGQRLLVISAVVLLAYAGSAVVGHYQATRQPQLPPPDQVVTTSTDHPSETKPDTSRAKYRVAPDKPRLISLPTIGAEGFIQQVGIDQHKAIAVPSNIHLAGWYTQSRLPGARGLSIIDGHLDGRTGGGIFKDLAKLKSGDRFTVSFGNDSTQTFTVRKVHRLATAKTAAVLFSQDPKFSHQLNLITCGGTYDNTKHQYDERVVVVAELTKK